MKEYAIAEMIPVLQPERAVGPEFEAGFPTFHALPPAPSVPTVAVLG